MSDARYFFAENSNRRIVTHNKRVLTFEPVEYFGGAWRGVFQATDPLDIEGLERLCNDPTTAIREIDLAEYQFYGKKKLKPESGYNPISTVIPHPSVQAALSGDGNVRVVENRSSEAEPVPTDGPVALEDVLELQKL